MIVGRIFEHPAAPVLKGAEHNRFFAPAAASKSGSLFEHCAWALDHSLATGAHAAALQPALEAAWDGEWYLRAYYDDGTPLGSHNDPDCRIDSIAKSWAVLSGVAPPDRAAQAMRSLERELVRPDEGLADGVVITPSHNPPEDGGFKYNTPDGGPADLHVTGDIEKAANTLLIAGLGGVKRIPLGRALKSTQLHRNDYIGPYVEELAQIVDMDIIRSSGVRIGIDPLGGAAVGLWQPIIARYGIAAAVHGRIAHGLGQSWYERTDAPATAAERMQLKALTPEGIGMAELAGEKVRATIAVAPGNGVPIGGVKMVAEHGWFAARPSGTEDIVKIYAESFHSEAHLREIQKGAQDALAQVFCQPRPAGLAD